MTLAAAVKACFRQYAAFQGRASRSEYWYFVLFTVVACLAAAIVDAVLGMSTGDDIFGVLSAITVLALLAPSVSVFVRRLHDTDRSGWWYWLALLPLVGGIILLVWVCQRGTGGENRYGRVPPDR